MQCRQIDELMMKYFDGNISELELEQLQRHNQKCPECAAEFEVLKDAIFEIEVLPEIEPPQELTANIMAAIAEQKPSAANKKVLLCGVLGFIGLVLFTYNIISHVVFPMFGVTPVDLIYMLAYKAKDSFVAMSLSLGKLVIVRDIIFREYTMYLALWFAAFVTAGLMLHRLIHMKKNRDFSEI